jgi:hypothetical protein
MQKRLVGTAESNCYVFILADFILLFAAVKVNYFPFYAVLAENIGIFKNKPDHTMQRSVFRTTDGNICFGVNIGYIKTT